MRRTAIVLIISTVLFWCSGALCRRPPSTRWDGDPDEYQAAAVHDEKSLNKPDLSRRVSKPKRTGRIAYGPETPAEAWSNFLGRLLWEVLHPGTLRPFRGEGR